MNGAGSASAAGLVGWKGLSVYSAGALGLPRELGAAALFLASDESSSITGAAIPVDGGCVADISRYA